jgi:hypothetical protein
MLRDADGDLFFGFCGMRVYVPDEDPRAEGIAEGVLRRFRERLREELAKDKPTPDSKPANGSHEPGRTASARWRG